MNQAGFPPSLVYVLFSSFFAVSMGSPGGNVVLGESYLALRDFSSLSGSFAFAVFSAGLLPLRHRKAWIVLQLGLRTLAQAAFKTDSG